MEERREHYPEMHKDISEIREDISILKKSINGNGKLGMFAKLELLWTSSIFIIITLIGVVIKVFIKGG